MRNFVKSFREIKLYYIYLIFPGVKLTGNSLNGCDKLSLARALCPETMLIISEYLIIQEVVDYVDVHYMFKNLAGH